MFYFIRLCSLFLYVFRLKVKIITLLEVRSIACSACIFRGYVRNGILSKSTHNGCVYICLYVYFDAHTKKLRKREEKRKKNCAVKMIKAIVLYSLVFSTTMFCVIFFFHPFFFFITSDQNRRALISRNFVFIFLALNPSFDSFLVCARRAHTPVTSA